MKKTHPRNNLIQQLILECKSLLGDNFNQHELKVTFDTLKEAKAKGFLGTDRLPSCCFVETVNTANQLLRICHSDEVLGEYIKYSKAFYAYIALVSLNCIKPA